MNMSATKAKEQILKRLETNKKHLAENHKVRSKILSSADKQHIHFNPQEKASFMEDVEQEDLKFAGVDEKITKIDGKKVDQVPEFPVYYENFIPKEDLDEYVDFDDSKELLKRIINADEPLNVLMYGVAGTGKTLLCETVGKELGMSVIQADCSEDMRRSNVIGGLKTTNEGGVMVTKWKHGPSGEAVESANQNPNGCLLIKEEGNMPRGEIQKLDNGLLDYRRSFYVPELGKYMRLKKGAKLVIILTMNPAGDGYAGNELEKSVADRYGIKWEKKFPTIEQCMEIAKPHIVGIPDKFVKGIMKLTLEVQNLAKEDKLTNVISPRNHKDIFKAWKVFKGLKNHEELVIEKSVLGIWQSDETEQELVRSRIESIFGKEAVKDNPEKEVEV